MGFHGFPPEAFEFYEGLAADNSRTYWQAHKQQYDEAVRGPMSELLEALDGFGPFHIFRPNRDVRFSKDKSPYKDHLGAFGETQGGAGYYIHLDAGGLMTGSGYYDMATDQLDRYRQAVDEERSGTEVARLCAEAEAGGLGVGAMHELKSAPRGYPRDHPRIELLRRKGLVTTKYWPRSAWMQTTKVVARVRGAWQAGAEINAWLDAHVGPSTLPPDDARR